MEGSSEAGSGWKRVCYAGGVLEHPGYAGGSGWVVPAPPFSASVHPAAEGFCLQVWGAVRTCTWLSAGSDP